MLWATTGGAVRHNGAAAVSVPACCLPTASLL